MGGAADKAGNRYERRWTLLAVLDLLIGKAQSLQVEVPGEKGAGAEFLQVAADGTPVWHQVKRQHASGQWTIASLVNNKVVEPWWPKIRSGGRFVFVSSTSAQELAEMVERASAADSWPVFDQDFLASDASRARFERLRQAWGHPSGAEVYAALRNIEVRQIGESDLRELLEARLAGLGEGGEVTRGVVAGRPSTAAAILEQFIDDSTHRTLTAPDVWRRLAEHGLRPRAAAGTSRPGKGTARSSGPFIQVAESSGGVTITQVGGDYITVQAPRGTQRPRKGRHRKPNRILFASGILVIIAVVAAITAFVNSPDAGTGPTRPQVQPLSGHAKMQLQAVQVPLTAKIAKLLGQSGTTNSSTITGYEFMNAGSNSALACLGALTTGSDAGHDRDPVRTASCSNRATNEIWIPVNWEQDQQNLTWLVNDQYQSMCLNVDESSGNGSPAQLYGCYHNADAPYGLALNEAWDFGDWYADMKSAVSPSPFFLGSSDFCLEADNHGAALSKASDLSDGTEVDIQPYSHLAANQYWS
jgi:hypothetical protein